MRKREEKENGYMTREVSCDASRYTEKLYLYSRIAHTGMMFIPAERLQSHQNGL